MSKDLVVGDLHIQINNLEESRRLLTYIKQVYLENQCRNLILLGDVFHTHSVVRQEVAYLFLEFIKDFYYSAISTDKSKLIIIAGNHDGISPTNATKNALDLIASEFATVISNNDGYISKDGYVFMPFLHNGDDFITLSNNNYDSSLVMGVSDPILICHQTFDGAAYESGAPAPHGVNSDKLKYTSIISGHIHTRQVIKDKVMYVGTPRAVTAGEVNDPKFLHIISRNDDGSLVFNEIPTKDIVKNYYAFDVKEDDALTYNINLEGIDLSKDKVSVRITGTQAFYDRFISENKQFLGVLRFIPKIKKDLDKKIDIEGTGESLEVSLERYVKTIADLDEEMKGDVWQIIQQNLQ